MNKLLKRDPSEANIQDCRHMHDGMHTLTGSLVASL